MHCMLFVLVGWKIECLCVIQEKQSTQPLPRFHLLVNISCWLVLREETELVPDGELFQPI